MYNHQLDTFLKVAELGSFGKAAEALYISVPAAIQQVNLLEERCGLKVFFRSNHGVRLTPAGRSLLEDAKTIIRLSIAIFKIKAHSHKNGTNPSNQRSLQHKKPSEWLQADHPKTGL